MDTLFFNVEQSKKINEQILGHINSGRVSYDDIKEALKLSRKFNVRYNYKYTISVLENLKKLNIHIEYPNMGVR